MVCRSEDWLPERSGTDGGRSIEYRVRENSHHKVQPWFMVHKLPERRFFSMSRFSLMTLSVFVTIRHCLFEFKFDLYPFHPMHGYSLCYILRICSRCYFRSNLRNERLHPASRNSWFQLCGRKRRIGSKLHDIVHLHTPSVWCLNTDNVD